MIVEVLASSGESEYVGGTITELTGKDISTASYQMALGSDVRPGTWSAPSVSTVGPGGNSTRIVKLLIGASAATPNGTYYVWAKITDNPEVNAVRFPQKIVVR
jgi:hypothetical protein